jgi:hypothetical protein
MATGSLNTINRQINTNLVALLPSQQMTAFLGGLHVPIEIVEIK